MFHEYSHDASARQAAKNINALYGDGLTSERTWQDWFQQFRSGDVSLEDKSRSRRPVELDKQALIDFIKEDNRQSTRNLAEQLNVGHSTVAEHL